MAIPVAAIQALLAAKQAQQGAPVAGPGPLAPPAASPFPSTDPTAVGQMLDPLAQAQQADQQQLAQEQAQAASGAMQMLIEKLANGPSPMAAAAQGGPGRPVSAPVAGSDSASQGGSVGY